MPIYLTFPWERLMLPVVGYSTKICSLVVSPSSQGRVFMWVGADVAT